MRSLASTEIGSTARDSAPLGAAWVDFETLYREEFRFVWRTARRLGVDGAAVDDVVQEVFVVVHRRLADFEGRSSAKTWLYGIVRRVVADHRRTLRRKPLETTPAGEDDDRASPPEGSPEAWTEQAERVRLLHRLLGELDEVKREVFILAELESLTLAEIAEVLGVNANTVASRLRAARREFEAALEQATETDDALESSAEPRRPR